MPIPISDYREALKETNICYIEEYIKSFTAKNMNKDSNTLTLSGHNSIKILMNGYKKMDLETNVIKIKYIKTDI